VRTTAYSIEDEFYPRISGNSVTYGDGKFVVVGGSGVFTSETGELWEEQTVLTTVDLFGITRSSDQFVAVGAEGTIVHSNDGIHWMQSLTSATNSLRDIPSTEEMFVSVGDHGTILTSPDAREWTDRSLSIPNNLLNVVWGESGFVAVGGSVDAGRDNGIVVSSVDGIDWKIQLFVPNDSFWGVAFGNQIYFALGTSLLTSSEGIDWRVGNPFPKSPLGDVVDGVKFLDGHFLASGNEIYSSSTGFDWEPTGYRGFGVRNIASGGGRYVGVFRDPKQFHYHGTPNSVPDSNRRSSDSLLPGVGSIRDSSPVNGQRICGDSVGILVSPR